MNLFEYQQQKNMKKDSPLANRLRPTKLEHFFGQEHIVGKNTFLYRAIMADKLPNIIFYGPPGTGKTSLAKVIASSTKSNFETINATTSGVKDIKNIINNAKDMYSYSGKKTILFIDEIHRFNKSQQDTLLPFVEDGTVILIGATTENPYFEVNKALISRSVILELKHLSKENILLLLNRALNDTESGLGNLKVSVKEDALEFLSDYSNGDARTALNAIELAVLTTPCSEDGKVYVDLEIISQCIQKRVLNYDKSGDNHYDTISAFIKSMRGSDPDASLYYLARMLYAGEDPKFIARRIIICASEDVGNADPHALQVAVSAYQATDFIGMPECRIILAQAVQYVSSAPKSNSAITSIEKAWNDVLSVQISGVPPYLQGSHSRTPKENETQKYKYPHDYEGHYVRQQYLPDELVGKIYYEPSENGVEKKIKESLKKLRP